MLAVKYLLKLYETPPENGHISAFDTYGNTVFAGTDSGVLMRFVVEGATSPEIVPTEGSLSGDARDRHISGGNSARSAEAGGVGEEQQAHEEMHADDFHAVSQLEKIYTTLVHHVVVSETQRRVERIQHSRTHKILFVLCEHRLLVLNSITFEHIYTVSDYVGTFFVSDSRQTSSQRVGRHVICTTEPHGRELRVYEFDIAQNKHVRPMAPHKVMLHEQAQTLVTYGNMVCVGMRRGGYRLLSLPDGNTCSVLPLSGDMQPLLAVGDGEVFMRYDHSIFSVSMRSMPSGRVLGRTIQLEDEVRHMIARHPFLFAFTESYCDVYSLYDDDVSERLPMSGCLFGSQLGGGDFLYAASATKIWMAGLHPLRHQLADLVERFKVEEAFHLLSTQRSRNSLDWQAIELELHVMVGFAYLHRCRPKEAMLHFNDHIDPRDLLLLLPECIPPGPDEYSSELRGLLKGDYVGETRTSSDGVDFASKDEDVVNVPVGGNNVEPLLAKCGPDIGCWDGGFWEEWSGCCPYNTYIGELEKAWLETFETFPTVPRSTDQADGVIHRQVMEWGCITAEGFLERSWEALKDELVVYFRSRLDQASPVHARPMEYALLVLALEARDHREAYQIVVKSSSLSVEDCYDLLCSLHEYRLLACLLYCRGYTQDADRLLRQRVCVSSLLPPWVAGRCNNSKQSPAYMNVPTALHSQLTRLLTPLPKNECLVVADLSSPRGAHSPNDVDETHTINLPLSLSLPMYLVSHLNIPALQELLAEDPDAAVITDEEGCTLLHVLFSLFISVRDLTEGEAMTKGSALVGLVLSCAVLLLDHGADVAAPNVHGITCLDVLAIAAGGAFFDIVVSALLADRDVRKAAAFTNKDDNTLVNGFIPIA